MEYHRPGLGGLPLALRLSEGLGVTRARADVDILDLGVQLGPLLFPTVRPDAEADRHHE